MAKLIKTHRDLDVYQTAVTAALAASALTRRFPVDEFSLKDQARRSARSPGACVAEAWRKRRYTQYWKNKLSDGQAEAAETQHWLEIGWREGYCTEEEFTGAFDLFEKVIAQMAKMIIDAPAWSR